MKDGNTDLAIVIGIMQSPAFRPRDVLEAMRRLTEEYGKPVVFVAPGGTYTVENMKMMELEARIPSFKTPEEAARAYHFLIAWYRGYWRIRGSGPGNAA
jgi:acyl-CoA synthetase (NDP forming)